jgi:hypothetical protein
MKRWPESHDQLGILTTIMALSLKKTLFSAI